MKGMNGAEGIVAVSLPLAAGVTLSSATGLGLESARISLAASCLILFILIHRKGRDGVPAALLFLFIGIFCHSSRTCVPPSDSGPWLSIAPLTELIDSLPFAHPSTNALIKALLTGNRESLTAEMLTDFRASGASHLLALSGLHLGVLYGIVCRMLSVFGNSRTAVCVRSFLVISLSIAYTIATGSSPSIVRACIFITIREALRLQTQRRCSPAGILCSSLTIQLTINPSVIGSVGFQLSYLAMTGILLLYPALKKWYPGPEKRRSWDIAGKIWDAAALAFSCQLFTAPLVWRRFGTFPEHFLLTNLIAMPVCETLMVPAAFSVLLGAVGLCPEFLPEVTDSLAQALLFCLHTIASISACT